MGALADTRRALLSGERSAVDTAEEALAAVEASTTNAWVRPSERLLEDAAALDERVARGEDPGPLAGVPVGIKDQICTRGLATTAASRILEGFVPPYDATVVRRLREAGALVLGKLNQDELAMGSSSERSLYGPVDHPLAPGRVPGGSSGGSAAAVAEGSCLLSLGTDTGGSIRQPASLCGVVGLKPTYGRVSRYGSIAFASSLDQVGPFTRSVEDAALALEVLAGHDPLDSTSLPEPVPAYTEALTGKVQGLRIGVPRDLLASGLEPDVEARLEEALDVYGVLGAELVDVELPHARYAIACYYVLATAEASSNLARYDGIRYGHRAEGASDLAQLYARSRAEGFGEEVRRRIMLGTFVLSSGYYDAYYLRAQKVRTLVRRDFARAFERADVLAMPASPVTAFERGTCTGDPLAMYLMDALTIPASLAGLPGLSVPAGVDGGGLPVGLQVVGRALDEATILRAAHALEQAQAGGGADG